MNTKMEGLSVYVMPISGGYFVNQIALLLELSTLHLPTPRLGVAHVQPLVNIGSPLTHVRRCSSSGVTRAVESPLVTVRGEASSGTSPVPRSLSVTPPKGDAPDREKQASHATPPTPSPIIPDIVMGGSGGNVAAYVACAGGWTEQGIQRVARMLSPEIFAAPRFPMLPTLLNAALSAIMSKKSIFKQAQRERCVAFFESFLDSTTSGRVEMWTGTVNRTARRAQMFCNRSESEAILRVPSSREALIGCLPPVYLGGDVTRIAKVSLASASIPTIVPPVEIDGEEYNDCGCAFSDPLPALQDRLEAVVGDGPVHITIIAGYDIERTDMATSVDSLYDEGASALHCIQASLALQSRRYAIDLVRSGPGGDVMYEEGRCDAVILRSIHEQRCAGGEFRRSVLELYPDGQHHVDILDFTPDELDVTVETTRRNYRYRLWWRTRS